MLRRFACWHRNSNLNLLINLLHVDKSCLSLTPVNRSLDDFFDEKKNWGKSSVTAGRPWRKEELRLKSNEDLHKLWYVLLKERNMLMTMEEEHNRCLERMPNPERFEKVEESMENLLMVVEERDRAQAELEQGAWIGPTVVNTIDALGRPVEALTSEHVEPRIANRQAQAEEKMWSAKTVQLLRLERESKIRKARDKAEKARFESRLKEWKKLDYINEDSIEKQKM